MYVFISVVIYIFIYFARSFVRSPWLYFVVSLFMYVCLSFNIYIYIYIVVICFIRYLFLSLVLYVCPAFFLQWFRY